jgi:hypothetical protein
VRVFSDLVLGRHNLRGAFGGDACVVGVHMAADATHVCVAVQHSGAHLSLVSLPVPLLPVSLIAAARLTRRLTRIRELFGVLAAAAEEMRQRWESGCGVLAKQTRVLRDLLREDSEDPPSARAALLVLLACGNATPALTRWLSSLSPSVLTPLWTRLRDAHLQVQRIAVRHALPVARALVAEVNALRAPHLSLVVGGRVHRRESRVCDALGDIAAQLVRSCAAISRAAAVVWAGETELFTWLRLEAFRLRNDDIVPVEVASITHDSAALAALLAKSQMTGGGGVGGMQLPRLLGSRERGTAASLRRDERQAARKRQRQAKRSVRGGGDRGAGEAQVGLGSGAGLGFSFMPPAAAAREETQPEAPGGGGDVSDEDSDDSDDDELEARDNESIVPLLAAFDAACDDMAACVAAETVADGVFKWDSAHVCHLGTYSTATTPAHTRLDVDLTPHPTEPSTVLVACVAPDDASIPGRCFILPRYGVPVPDDDPEDTGPRSCVLPRDVLACRFYRDDQVVLVRRGSSDETDESDSAAAAASAAAASSQGVRVCLASMDDQSWVSWAGDGDNDGDNAEAGSGWESERETRVGGVSSAGARMTVSLPRGLACLTVAQPVQMAVVFDLEEEVEDEDDDDEEEEEDDE